MPEHSRMLGFLWEMRPYFRQVAGQLVLGSVAGIIMNTAVVLPAILLGRAIDRALSWERGAATAGDVGWAALAFVGGTLLTEVPRIGKRWWLMTANARIRANVRADAFRGVLAWPMANVQRTPVGDLMARIIGDVEVLGVGVREFTIEIWDTVLFSLYFVVAMLVFDPSLTLLALLPAPLAMVLAHATGRWVAGRTTKAREASADLTSAIQEHLAGIRVLRLFGRASASVERIAELSLRFAERNLSLARLKGGLQPIYAARPFGTRALKLQRCASSISTFPPGFWSGSRGPSALARVRSRGRSSGSIRSSRETCSSMAVPSQNSHRRSGEDSSDTCHRTRSCSPARYGKISR